jgi:hypothetical protein
MPLQRLSARLYGMAEAMPLHFSVPEVSFSASWKAAPLCPFTGCSRLPLLSFPSTRQERALARDPGLKIETRATLG